MQRRKLARGLEISQHLRRDPHMLPQLRPWMHNPIPDRLETQAMPLPETTSSTSAIACSAPWIPTFFVADFSAPAPVA